MSTRPSRLICILGMAHFQIWKPSDSMEHIVAHMSHIVAHMSHIMAHNKPTVSISEKRGRAEMLEPILGSESSERVLVFILAREKGYAREIARFFDTEHHPIRKQLNRLELGGVLVSRTAGRTRVYEFNPRYAFLEEIRNLLKKALSFYPSSEQERLMMNRRRPRRRGKPE